MGTGVGCGFAFAAAFALTIWSWRHLCLEKGWIWIRVGLELGLVIASHSLSPAHSRVDPVSHMTICAFVCAITIAKVGTRDLEQLTVKMFSLLGVDVAGGKMSDSQLRDLLVAPSSSEEVVEIRKTLTAWELDPEDILELAVRACVTLLCVSMHVLRQQQQQQQQQQLR